MTKEQREALRRLKAMVREHGCRGTAETLGLSPMFVSEMMRGNRNPGVKAMRALAQVAE